MRVALLYQPSAGAGVSVEPLQRVLEERGHSLVGWSHGISSLEPVLDRAPDLLVAAGGDGTVRQTATAVAGRGIPMAIFPLGTANNVARSLEIPLSIPEVVDSWSEGALTPVDLGILRIGSQQDQFIEGVGAGLLPHCIEVIDRSCASSIQESTELRLVRALRRYHEILAHLQPQPLTLRLDGVAMKGSFLLAQVLNVGSIGANLVLAPSADLSDGRLDVVLAEEEHRAALQSYLRDRIEGRSGCALDLPVLRARSVELGARDQIHVDSEVRAPPQTPIHLHLRRAAVRFLV